ncbi:MAG: GNAT family N-acetyltransferase [Maribacter sp.]|nr:GNAT family N-acetyltransferase [Maribacter sp.]
MIEIVRTSSENQDFIALVAKLDADLAVRDGDDHAFYHQFNNIDVIKHGIVLYENQEPVGCGAIKEFDSKSMEIKRMYTTPKNRGKGFATRILSELEKWTEELFFERCVLETGKRQPEAIKLYTKNGYNKIANFGPYNGIENSVCFEKFF